MGIFDFVKEAGHKILNDMGDAAAKAAADVGVNNGDPANKQRWAENIKQRLDQYNLGTENVNVSVDGDKAHLSGEVSDQAALEKAVLAVGNMLGISQVNASNLKAQNNNNNLGAKNSRFYEVKRGDSLWQIAEAVYGASHGDKYKIIYEANRPMLSSADDIFPGQMLRIPNIDAA